MVVVFPVRLSFQMTGSSRYFPTQFEIGATPSPCERLLCCYVRLTVRLLLRFRHTRTRCWLTRLTTDVAGENTLPPVPIFKYEGRMQESGWLPSEAVAKAWMQYVKDTAVTDITPPPAPTSIRILDNELTWEAEADLESGLASFLIERDGQFLANVPDLGKNPYGRPVFQNLQYSDTPSQPLFQMRFIDTKPESGKTHRYRVISVNTVGLKSR